MSSSSKGASSRPTGCVVPIAERHVLTGGYASSSQIFPVAEGWLTQVQIRATLRGDAARPDVRDPRSDPRPGGRGAIARHAAPGLRHDELAARVAGRRARSRRSAGAASCATSAGTIPPPGAEISESVPAGVRWLLKTFTFVLVASAAAANRSPILTIDDGATVIFETGSNVLQIAGADGEVPRRRGRAARAVRHARVPLAAPAGSVARRRLAHSHGDGRT
jgi:hypothetical protein